MSSRRYCGGCVECCRTMAVTDVPEGPKPRNVLCRHADGLAGQCRIYDARPRSCRDYRCLWLEGFAELADRPDRSGIVFGIGTIGEMSWPVARIAPAGLRGQGAELLRRIRPVIVVQGEDCELLAPLPILAMAARVADGRRKLFPNLNLDNRRVRWRLLPLEAK
jgi:hypothetical protein